MATLKETAQAYVPTQTKNIADLERVSVDVEIKQETKKDGEGKEFTYNYFEYKNEKYKVPGIVIGSIKALVARFPNLKYVSVIKEGQGMTTKYQVVPLLEQTPQ